MNSLLAISLPRPEKFWHVEIPGEPQPWKRVGQGKYGHKYNRSAKDEKGFAWQFRAACPEIRCDDGSILWGIRFRFCTGRKISGDLDNLMKQCADSIQSIVFENDRMVKEAFMVVVPSKRPRTEMLLYHVSPDYLASWSDL
jgi:Holliday junction resolvase RusA-like endonuclease